MRCQDRDRLSTRLFVCLRVGSAGAELTHESHAPFGNHFLGVLMYGAEHAADAARGSVIRHRGEHEAHNHPQGRGPLRRVTERRRRPVVVANEPRHRAFLREEVEGGVR